MFHSLSSIEESTKENRLDEEIQYKRLINRFFLNIEIKTTSREEKKEIDRNKKEEKNRITELRRKRTENDRIEIETRDE